MVPELRKSESCGGLIPPLVSLHPVRAAKKISRIHKALWPTSWDFSIFPRSLILCCSFWHERAVDNPKQSSEFLFLFVDVWPWYAIVGGLNLPYRQCRTGTFLMVSNMRLISISFSPEWWIFCKGTLLWYDTRCMAMLLLTHFNGKKRLPESLNLQQNRPLAKLDPSYPYQAVRTRSPDLISTNRKCCYWPFLCSMGGRFGPPLLMLHALRTPSITMDQYSSIGCVSRPLDISSNLLCACSNISK